MFTLEEIKDIHDRLGKRKTLPDYLRALHAIGVDFHDSYLTDGHSEYCGANHQKIVSPPVHEKLTIAKKGNREGLKKHLDLHAQGKSDYLEMSRGLAENGIEKWTFDTDKMTIAYYGLDGREMLVEMIE